MQPYTTPKGDAFNAALQRVLPGAVHHNFRGRGDAVPVHLQAASGSRVTDIDGNTYLDLSAAYGALILGHGHQEFADAMKDQVGRLLQVANSDLELRAIEAVQRWFAAAEMVRFGLSGTEMMANAIRLARGFTGRQKILRFGGHYHGSTDALLGGFPPPEPGPPLRAPGDAFESEGLAAGVLERECLMAPWNDEARLRQSVEAFGQSIACVVMEPICINGGGAAIAPAFARAVVECCRRHGILLILDETITGIRAGPGGAQAGLGLVPDLFVAGKAISNGIPISVLGGRAEIMGLLANRRVIHGGTYNGYPLGLRAIIATLDILSRDDFAALKKSALKVDKAAVLLCRAAADYGVPFHVRRHASMAVLHPGQADTNGDDPLAYAALPAILSASTFSKALQRFGVLLCPICRCYGTIALDDDDIDFLIDRSRAAFAADGVRIARLAAADKGRGQPAGGRHNETA